MTVNVVRFARFFACAALVLSIGNGLTSGAHARAPGSADAINITGLSTNTLVAGTSAVIVISGTGFPSAAAPAPEVTIGSELLTVTFHNTTTIQATVGPERLTVAKLYQLKVKASNSSDADTIGFTVTPGPLAALVVGMDSLTPGNPLTPTVPINASLVYSVTGRDEYANALQTPK